MQLICNESFIDTISKDFFQRRLFGMADSIKKNQFLDSKYITIKLNYKFRVRSKKFIAL